MDQNARAERLLLIGGLLAWSFVAYLSIFVFAGSHLCGGATLQPIPVDGAAFIPLTQAQLEARVADCASRPDLVAIVVFGLGYLVFGVILWRRRGAYLGRLDR